MVDLELKEFSLKYSPTFKSPKEACAEAYIIIFLVIVNIK